MNNIPPLGLFGNLSSSSSDFKLILYKDKNNPFKEFRWQVKAKNGNIVADSGEGYFNKSECLSMAQRILKPEISNNLEDLT